MKNDALADTFLKAIVIPASLSILLLIFHFNFALLAIFKAVSFFAFVLLMLLFVKFKQPVLPGKQQHSTLGILARLFGIQAFFVLLILSIASVLSLQSPSLQTAAPIDFRHVPSVFFSEWGLFPWSIFTLMALVIGHPYQPPQSSLLKPTFLALGNPKLVDTLMGPLSDFFVRRSQFILLALPLSLLIFHAVTLLNEKLHLPAIAYFSFRSLLIALLVYWLGGRKILMPFLKKSLSRLPMPVMLVVYAVMTIALCVGLNAAIQLSHQGFKDVISANDISLLKNTNWPAYWVLLLWSFCVVCVPFFASYYWRVCQGLSIRRLIVLSMVGPLLFHWLWPALQYLSVPYLTPTTGLCLASAILLYFTNNTRLDFAFLPHPAQALLRRPEKNLVKVLHLTTALLSIFMVSWLFSAPLLILILSVPFFFVLLTAVFAFLLGISTR